MTSGCNGTKALSGPLGLGLLSFLLSGTALAQKYDGSGSPTFVPHTLQEALSTAYLTNPTLREERARLRATDEQVPTAMAGWHPTIQTTMNLTYYDGQTNYAAGSGNLGTNQRYQTPGYSGGVNITQPLYEGGKTVAGIHAATNQVMAERAKLISTEQTVFTNVVNAYVGVVQDEQLLQLAINNERVLQQQVQATQERFHVGEITRTDVAQAQAALASATAQRQQAEGTLQGAQATYMQVVGIAAPPNIEAPQPLKLPVQSEREVVALAVQNNPDVVNALFTEAQQKDNVSVQISAIMPKVSAELAFQHSINQGYSRSLTDNKYGMLAFQIPIYQGGSEYSAIRGARQQAQAAHREVDVQRRTALQKGAASWQQMVAFKQSINSDRVAISANVIALDGVERQALVGTSTTLAVLQQQQTLLQAQQTLVQHLSNLVISSYAVAASIGRLTASDLKLGVPLYDEKAYYNAVKNRLWGTSDYAINQPGR
ncbi:TolC family outer membrane protein [Gluconobacter cerinus]|nr:MULTISPECIES: TolC family outer membrane protein [Gluconobacter]MBS0994557.1 TolC family outer membrane protein [Gluconobacter cerinus]MBS1018901.1 TolC family outer membrane protein [Gluconobacter cerinus]MBS1021957.1 TolC family outer membrane protein [Gluconobacter cerinus]MBS1025719.1 TolC family outer membrane protein [Gluconobacter cerinus]MBS1031035.1 TolC family outer membrane protein [Gluconobacter cerinus]